MSSDLLNIGMNGIRNGLHGMAKAGHDIASAGVATSSTPDADRPAHQGVASADQADGVNEFDFDGLSSTDVPDNMLEALVRLRQHAAEVEAAVEVVRAADLTLASLLGGRGTNH